MRIVHVSALIDGYSKGNRVIINVNTTKKPEYYIATVTKISKSKNLVYVRFDDGEKWQYKATSSKVGLMGHALKTSKRIKKIKPKNIGKWLSVNDTPPLKKAKDVSPYKFSIGDRVAYTLKNPNRYTLGTVVGATGKTLDIESDNYVEDTVVYNGKQEAGSNVLPVSNWELTKRPVDYSSLLIRKVSTLEFMQNRSLNISLTLPLARSAFYMVDDRVFDGALNDIPEFNFNMKSSKLLGEFVHPKFRDNAPDTKMRLNSMKLQTPWAMLATLAHEMVHQWQYEKFGSAFDEENGWHGKTFMSWESKIQSKLGVPLNRYDTAEEREVFDSMDYVTPQGRKLSQPNYVVAFSNSKGDVAAMSIKSEKVARRGASAFSTNESLTFVGIFTFPYSVAGTGIKVPRKNFSMSYIKPPVVGMLHKFSSNVDTTPPVSLRYMPIEEYNNMFEVTKDRTWDDKQIAALRQHTGVLANPYYVGMWTAPNSDGRHWAKVYARESDARDEGQLFASLMSEKYGFNPGSMGFNVFVFDHNMWKELGISDLGLCQIHKGTALALLDHFRDPDDIQVDPRLAELRELHSELKDIRDKIVQEPQMNRKVEMNMRANEIKKRLAELQGL
ncbi:hypothetical protein GR11A_00024 [Vibrio phage vB_VcorM_GR11A]|nr:hypothetical protein GR11A_00024 [Vibrio phage vB_VcorM_GR11A]